MKMIKRTMKRMDNRTAMIIRISGNTPSMLISRRLFSSVYDKNHYDRNIVMLTSAIDSIYNEEWRVRGVLPFKKDYLLMHLLTNDYYAFEPLDYYQYKKSEIPGFLYELLVIESRNGYLWLNEWVHDGEDMIGVYKCRTAEDLLLIRGLSKVILNSMIVSDTSRNLSRLSDLMTPHYDFLNRQHNVVKVINVDLIDCMNYLRVSDILLRVDFFASRGLIFELIKQFLNLSIYDNKIKELLHLGGIPPMGEITDVILHHFYGRVFDTALERAFPGITYTRWSHEVYIVIKETDSFTIEIEDMKILLHRIGLIDGSEISSMNRGDLGCLPTSNEEKAVILYEDGDVEVWNFEDM